MLRCPEASYRFPDSQHKKVMFLSGWSIATSKPHKRFPIIVKSVKGREGAFVTYIRDWKNNQQFKNSINIRLKVCKS